MHGKKKKKLTPEELAEQTLLASMTPKSVPRTKRKKEREIGWHESEGLALSNQVRRKRPMRSTAKAP